MTFWTFVSENPGWAFLFLLIIACVIESVAMAIVHRKSGK